MSIPFQCPHCQAKRTAKDSLAGRKIRCPNCKKPVRIPGAETAPAKAVVAAGATQSSEPTSAAAVTTPKATETPPVDDGAFEESYVNFRDREKGEEMEMDMTPMVDVTFLLLIFFMVTAAFSLQKSIEIPKPEQTDEPSSQVVEQDETPEMVTVLVDEFNTFHVLSAEWERECPSEQDLLVRLREARGGGTTGVIPTRLLVKAHGDSLHERVVLALDAGTAVGFEQVQLMTVEETF